MLDAQRKCGKSDGRMGEVNLSKAAMEGQLHFIRTEIKAIL